VPCVRNDTWGRFVFHLSDAVCKYAGNPTEAIIKAQKTIIEKMFGRIIAERISSNETPAGFTYAHYLEVSANYLFTDKTPDIITRTFAGKLSPDLAIIANRSTYLLFQCTLLPYGQRASYPHPRTVNN